MGVLNYLKDVDEFFDLVSNNLTFSNIKPKNIKKQKDLFFKKGYSPVLIYESCDKEKLRGLNYVLKNMKFGNSSLEKIYEFKRKELVKKINLILSIGTDKFSDFSSKLYFPPSEKLVKVAYDFLKLEDLSSSSKILRKDFVKLVRKIFRDLKLNWKIISCEMVTSANVDLKNKKLELRKKERFSSAYAKRLIVHEVGTHILRYENGALHGLKIFKNGLANYLSTEEGLAVYNELHQGFLTPHLLRNYAGRVIAVNYAMNHSFKKTYEHLRKYFNEKTAFNLCVRVKRGMKNTAKKGAYTKDGLYLSGFIDVLKYSWKNDVEKLYIGKIGIKDLKFLEELNLKKPKYTFKEIINEELEPLQNSVVREKIEEIIQKYY